MTAIDPTALLALCDAATPGPWTTYRDSIAASAWVVVDDGTDLYAEGSDPNASTPVCMIESDAHTLAWEQGDADAAYIAALDPDTVRALVAAYVEHQGCPDALAADRERLAAAVEVEAERARETPHGLHPAIPSQTHAAALRYAARIIRAGGTT